MAQRNYSKTGRLIITLIATSTLSTTAIALDNASNEAMASSQQLLRDKTVRSAAIKASPDAQSNHRELEKLLGANGADGAYELSAEIFTTIVNDSNGDQAVMMEKMQLAQKDPAAFLKSLSPEHRARIKSMANRAQSNKP